MAASCRFKLIETGRASGFRGLHDTERSIPSPSRESLARAMHRFELTPDLYASTSGSTPCETDRRKPSSVAVSALAKHFVTCLPNVVPTRSNVGLIAEVKSQGLNTVTI